jgi:peptidoglycan/xylan/chitin deacetylase (PgdA/CDA1 family)
VLDSAFGHSASVTLGEVIDKPMGARLTHPTLLIVGLLLAATACTSARTASRPAPVEPPAPTIPPPPVPAPPPAPATPPTVERLPERFESDEFVVVFAQAGETTETLAARHLGEPRKAWMIEDYMGLRTFAEGREVVIPKRDWNPVGVSTSGYQLVPVLVYHRLELEPKGRLTISASKFEAQMRYLHRNGFRAVTVRDFLEFTAGQRQLPRKSVLLAFDDGYRSFLQFARPVLEDLGFSATLFVYTDYVGAGANALSWPELRELLSSGFDVQAHSKTHGNLRRREGEPEAEYAKRMEAELAHPLALFRKHLGGASQTLAYPYGDTDEELVRQVVERGYLGAFTVRRQANPAFVFPLKMNRSQIYAEMTLEEFARNLTVFQDEDLSMATPPDGKASASPDAALPLPLSTISPASSAVSPRERLAAPHNETARMLEQRGRLRQALEERLIALTINPGDLAAQAARKRLEGRIPREVADLLSEGRALLGRGSLGEARQRFLTVLALDPTNRTAFETLQNEVREVTIILHTVRPGDTLGSLAELYYGDRFRAEVIAETNHLPPNTGLVAGRTLRIPEIPGVPILPR